ncbi:MAG: hypothetical protein J1D88_10105 [Treponema sp.]|nr:hypothetical protein [Treponema sp.]
MKKNLAVFAAVLSLSFCAAAQAPDFDGEDAYVIDAGAIAGKFKDNVVLVNKTQEEICAVKVFANSNGEWQEIGSREFGAFDEELKIKSSKTLKLPSCQFFAVQAQNGFQAVYKATKQRNDLLIEVRSEGSDLKKPACPRFDKNPDAFVFDVASLGEDADENLKIRCYFVPKGKVSFLVSVYDRKSRKWIQWGTAEVKRNGDTQKVKGGKHGDLDDYRYFAVEAMDGQEYNYVPLVDDDDLYINISM